MAVTQSTNLADFSSGVGTGGNTINVGTALTLGHTQGLQFHTQNLHATGFEVNNINASGIITASSANFTGNISVGGTLTYEDVTNIDSVGLITARNGIHVTAGTVGIGTDNPALKLHVEDSGSQIIRFARTGIGAGSLDIDGDGNAVFNSHTTNADVIFHTQTNERLRITSAGRVGIGTTIPGSVLDIQRAAAGNEPLLRIRSHDTAAGNFTGDYSVEIRHATSTVTHGMLISNKETVNDRRTLDIADGNGVFATFTNGKVGIGTNDPKTKLEVYNGKIRGGSAASTAGSTLIENRYSSPHVLNILGSMHSSGGTALTYGLRPKEGSEGFDSSFSNFSGGRVAVVLQGSGLRIQTAASQNTTVGDTVSVTNRVIVDLDGNVGINTNDPQKNLHVNSASANSFGIVRISGRNRGGQLEFCTDATKTAGIYSPTSSNELVFFTSSSETERLRIDSAGALNIGSGSETTNAANLVEMYVGSTDGTYGTIRGKYNRSNEYTRSEVRFGVESNASGLGFLAFATGNNTATEKLRITSGGLIGIGTNNPQGELHVKRNSSTGRIIIEGASKAQIGLRDNAGGTDSKVIQIRNDAQNLLFGTQNDSYGSFSEKLRITSDGKLILSGTQRTTPFISGDGGMCIEQNYDGNLRALTIRNKHTDADAATSLAFSLNRTGSDVDFVSGEIKLEKEQSWTTTPSTVDGAMVFSTIQNETVTEKLRITSAGLVGIGTDNPNEELHIHGSGTSYIQFSDESSGTGASDGAIFGLDHPHLYAWNYEAGDFVVATNATEAMRVTSGGHVISGNLTISGYLANSNSTISGFAQVNCDNHANTFFGQNIKLSASGGSGTHQLEIVNQHSTIGGAGMWIGGNGNSYNNQINFYAVPANQTAGTRVDQSPRFKIDPLGVAVNRLAAPRAQLDVQEASDHPPFNIGFTDSSFYRNLGTVGPNADDSSTGAYLHIRLRSVWNDSSMTMFRLTGYYPYSVYAESYVGMYRYGHASYRNSPYGQIIANQGTSSLVHSVYNTGVDPGYLVIVCYWNTTYNGVMVEHYGAGGTYGAYMQYDLEIIDTKRSAATSDQWPS